MAKKAKKLYAQKHFIDGAGKRVVKGEEIAEGRYDKVTIDHYKRHDMVGDKKPVAAPAVVKPAKAEEQKPAAPLETGSTEPQEQTSSVSPEGGEVDTENKESE